MCDLSTHSAEAQPFPAFRAAGTDPMRLSASTRWASGGFGHSECREFGQPGIPHSHSSSVALPRTMAIAPRVRSSRIGMRAAAGLSRVASRRSSLSFTARKIGVAPGTLENLRNGRMKRLSAWCFERLRSAVVHELQREIARCQHELEIARQTGLDPRSDEMASLAGSIRTAKEMIGEAK